MHGILCVCVCVGLCARTKQGVKVQLFSLSYKTDYFSPVCD